MAYISAQKPEDDLAKRQLGKKGLKTKADLMSAARAVFSRMGFVNARVQDITIEANFSLGAFYRYFKDKDDILDDLIAHYFEQSYATTFLDAHYDPKDPTRSLYKSTQQVIEFAAENRDLLKILWETSQTIPHIENRWNELRNRLNKRIAHFIERAQKDGISYADFDPASTAELLIGMTEHAVYRRLVRPPAVAADEPKKLAVRLTQLWAHALFRPEFTNVS
jgi:AcrR family transcriptional regulator